MSATYTATEAGCYLDGHFGWHNTYRVILEIAVPAGYELTPGDRAYVEAYRDGTEEILSPQDGETPIGQPEIHDAVQEIVVDVMDYLAAITADGLAWIWDMGELSLCRVDEDGEPTF